MSTIHYSLISSCQKAVLLNTAKSDEELIDELTSCDNRKSTMLANGVRLERHHCIQLKLSSTNIVKLSDWDIKQSIRKLDSECSSPLHERLDRCTQEKVVSFAIIYKNESSIEKLTNKISLLRNAVKIGPNILHVEVINESSKIDVRVIGLQQVIWLRNLPIRWFELDLLQGSCVVPVNHILRKHLDSSFGEIVHMESKSPKAGTSALLQCDVCIKFADESSCKKIMSELSSGSCVASKEGASIVFPVAAELDSSGYMDSKSISERKTLRDRIRAAQLQREADSMSLTSLVNEAEECLENAALDALDSDSVLKERDGLVNECDKGKILLKSSESSADHGDLEEIVDLTRADSRALKAASTLLARKIASFAQVIAIQQLSNKLAAQREAEKALQVTLHDNQRAANACVTKATEMCRVISQVSDATDCRETFQDILRRTEVLTSTLTQLLKTESGGQRYVQALQRSLSHIDDQIELILPISAQLTAFASLIESLDKSERDLSILRGAAPSLFPSHATDMAELAVRSLVKHGREKFKLFLKSIQVKSDDASALTEGGKSRVDSGDVRCSEGDMLDIAESVEVLMKVCEVALAAELLASSYLSSLQGKALNRDVTQTISVNDGGTEGALMSVAEQCECYTDSCICDSAEMKELSHLFQIEILQPYQDRIKRISQLLLAPLPLSFLLDSFRIGDVRRSTENAYDLLQVGIKDYEDDKKELRREANRIEQERVYEIKQKKIIEERRIEHEKNERRKLLEKKIALLKMKKKELEDEQQKNKDEAAAAAQEEERRKRGYASSDNARQEDFDFQNENQNEYENENGDCRSTDMDRYNDSERYASRYSDGREFERQPRRSECSRGDFVYALKPPCWDLQATTQTHTDSGHTAENRDNATTITAERRQWVSSTVGWKGNEEDSGIVSATRRKLSQGGVTLKGAVCAVAAAVTAPTNPCVAEEVMSVTHSAVDASNSEIAVDRGVALLSSSVGGIVQLPHTVVTVAVAAPAPQSVVAVAGASRKRKKVQTPLSGGDAGADAVTTVQPTAPAQAPPVALAVAVIAPAVVAAAAVEVALVKVAVEAALSVVDSKKQESHMREALLASKLKRKKLLKTN
jgi:hypothetical protein